MSLTFNDNSTTDRKSRREYFTCRCVSGPVYVIIVWICRQQFLDMRTEKLINTFGNTGKFIMYFHNKYSDNSIQFFIFNVLTQQKQDPITESAQDNNKQ
jgi:hypothetical protein